MYIDIRMETVKTDILPYIDDLAEIVLYGFAFRFEGSIILGLDVLKLLAFIYYIVVLNGSRDADPWFSTRDSRGSCLNDIGAMTGVVVIEWL